MWINNIILKSSLIRIELYIRFITLINITLNNIEFLKSIK